MRTSVDRPPCWLEKGEEERRFMNRSNPAHAEELWGMVDLVQQVGAIGILIVFGTEASVPCERVELKSSE